MQVETTSGQDAVPAANGAPAVTSTLTETEMYAYLLALTHYADAKRFDKVCMGCVCVGWCGGCCGGGAAEP